jgi:hypothetical protein
MPMLLRLLCLLCVPRPQVTRGEVIVIDRYGGWQAAVLRLLAGMINPADNSFPADAMAQVGRGLMGLRNGCCHGSCSGCCDGGGVGRGLCGPPCWDQK